MDNENLRSEENEKKIKNKLETREIKKYLGETYRIVNGVRKKCKTEVRKKV